MILDMSEFWTPGQDTPVQAVNGLDSGAVGPYSTPLSSAYFTPHLTAGAAQNNYVSNSGYILTGQLSQQTGLIAPVNGSDYAFEAWFELDPYVAAHVTTDTGPFIVLSLGDSRSGACLVLGVYNSSDHLTFQAMTYGQPPAFAMNNFGTSPSPLQSIGYEMASDVVPLPHHIVANVTGASAGAYLELYVDGTNAGGITLPVGTVYDAPVVGGAFGGWGCFYGNIQLVSVYQRILSGNEIQQHCNMGQYGMWESATDTCIARLGQFAGIPQFWNGLISQDAGLTLTDYYNIAGTSPLAAMQIYEQSEQGLIYVPANGTVNFATRATRQGHDGPDLLLPPDSYVSSLGYQLIDQYIINESAISTQTYPTGVVWQNFDSEDRYGPYSSGASVNVSGGFWSGYWAKRNQGTSTSPSGNNVQLPLITWDRAYDALGLPQYINSPSPVLNDMASWVVNTQGESRLTYSSIQVDLLTLDSTSGLTTSQLYGLEINSVIGLSGTLPTSIANAPLANELFIEGVSEVIGLNQRTLTFYTSPAGIQRAWIPGDPVYGVLGSTTRVGLSAPDMSVPPAIGKDVAHDSGGPYWPPKFTVENVSLYQFGLVSFTGTGGTLAGTAGLKRTYAGDYLIVQVMCPAAATVTVGPDSAGNAYVQIGSVSVADGFLYVFGCANANPLNSADTVPVSASVSQAYTAFLMGFAGVTALDQMVTGTGDGVSLAVSTGPMSEPFEAELVLFFNANDQFASVPEGWGFGQNVHAPGDGMNNSVFWKQSTLSVPGGTDTVNSTYGIGTAWAALTLTFTAQPVQLNNPGGSGRQFIGSLEMRGLHDTLDRVLQPPLTVVEAQNHSQPVPSGSNAAPEIIWDQIYTDTAGGMNAIPGWNNWYVCTVPGFYELSGSSKIVANSLSGTATGYIAVASQAAQAVAGGTLTPQTVGAYVCPVGEQHQQNDTLTGLSMAASTRIYLGVGDMVSLCSTQDTGSSGFTDAKGILSIRWCGYSTTNDQVMINSSLGGAGTVTQVPAWPASPVLGGNGISSASAVKKAYKTTWASTGTYSYYGTSAAISPQLIAANGNVMQGTGPFPGEGSMFSFVLFDYASIQAAIAGAGITSVSVECTNNGTYPGNDGVRMLIGWSTRTSFGNYCAPDAATDFMDYQEVDFRNGQTRVFGLGGWAGEFRSSATSLVIGNDVVAGSGYYGSWEPAWYLTISYTK